MNTKITILVLSLILVLSVIGSMIVFAGTFDSEQTTTTVTEIKFAENLELSSDISLPKRQHYERADAEQYKTITFRGRSVEVEYDYSNKDGFGNEYDVYRAVDDTLYSFEIYTLDKNGNIIGFDLMYPQEELIAFDDIKYYASIITVKNTDEAIAIANDFLENTCGIDLNTCEVLWSSYMEYHVYSISYTTKLGDFATEDVYYVNVSVTGEIFSYRHKSEPIPDASKVEGYSYDSVAQRAINDLKAVFGDRYRECTINRIYAEALPEGDYFMVNAEVQYVYENGIDVAPWGYTLYYEIK